MLPQMMPLPWLFIFFFVFFCVLLVSFFVSGLHMSVVVNGNSLKTSGVKMPW